jgi:hypothetical protein
LEVAKRNSNSNDDDYYELETVGPDLEIGPDTETGREADAEIGLDTETVGMDIETGREADAETETEANEVSKQQPIPEYHY